MFCFGWDTKRGKGGVKWSVVKFFYWSLNSWWLILFLSYPVHSWSAFIFHLFSQLVFHKLFPSMLKSLFWAAAFQRVFLSPGLPVLACWNGFQQSNWAEQFNPRAQEPPGAHLKRYTSKIHELCLLSVKHGKGASGFPVSWGGIFWLVDRRWNYEHSTKINWSICN